MQAPSTSDENDRQEQNWEDMVTQPTHELQDVKADNDEAKSKVPEGEMGVFLSVPTRSEEKLADVVSSQQDCILQDVVSGLSIKIYKIKGHKIIKKGNFKEKIDSARVGQAKRGKIKNKKIGAPPQSA